MNNEKYKPLPDPHADLDLPLKLLLRYQYKYRNPYNSRYILVYHETQYNDINDPDDEGVGKAIWSMYDDDDENFEENHIDLSDDFYKIMDEGEWEREGMPKDIVVK